MRWAVAAAVLLVVACSPTPKPTAAVHSPTVSPSPRPYPASSGGVVEYDLPNPANTPAGCAPFCRASLGDIALGADGNMWFEDLAHEVVGRITPRGGVEEFGVPYELGGGANTITAGPDGNVWVTASAGGNGRPDSILRVTPSGVITDFSAGDNSGADLGSGPESITLGPDGNLWFDEFWTNRIGKLTPSGTLTEFPIPTADSAPRGIVAGPDGNVWFVESTRLRPAIARITTAGVITEFPVSDGPTDNLPQHITVGPDGNLWFNNGTSIGHVSPRGAIVWMSLPANTRPANLVTASDGNIWFADESTESIARLTVTGAVREFKLPRRGPNVTGMAIGADGRVWFAEGDYPMVGSIGVRVPEMLVDLRPLVFAANAGQTVSIRNTGDAPLVIAGARVSGVDANLFNKASDTCSGVTVAPDRTCAIELRHGAGGPTGLQSALLEISDNATGSPQRIQLVAQTPKCTLPVVQPGEGSDPGVGELLDPTTGRVSIDPSGAIPGQTPGYYDRAYGGWLPVAQSSVSPDGSRYAYFAANDGQSAEIRVVEIGSGKEKSLRLPAGFWGIVGYTADGIYLHGAYEVIQPGLMLLNPDTGVIKTVFKDVAVEAIDGSSAWATTRNAADKLPSPRGIGAGSNQVMKRDLVSGKTTTWLYRPGTDVDVSGVVSGLPVVSVWDGFGSTVWLVTSPGQARRLDSPFSLDAGPDLHGFVADAAGIWMGSTEGVYLWTARTGSVLISASPATPAGTCA